MAGVAILVESPELDAALARLGGLSAALFGGALLDAAGALAESAARRRIQDEKRAPDGTPWAAWSARHAATRQSRQSLLVGEGDLLDSLGFERSGAEVRVGSPLVYAAIHQLGGEGTSRPDIPARPYLGLSAEDEADLIAVIDAFVEGRL